MSNEENITNEDLEILGILNSLINATKLGVARICFHKKSEPIVLDSLGIPLHAWVWNKGNNYGLYNDAPVPCLVDIKPSENTPDGQIPIMMEFKKMIALPHDIDFQNLVAVIAKKTLVADYKEKFDCDDIPVPDHAVRTDTYTVFESASGEQHPLEGSFIYFMSESDVGPLRQAMAEDYYGFAYAAAQSYFQNYFNNENPELFSRMGIGWAGRYGIWAAGGLSQGKDKKLLFELVRFAFLGAYLSNEGETALKNGHKFVCRISGFGSTMFEDFKQSLSDLVEEIRASVDPAPQPVAGLQL